jgi:hypothetical protein
VIERWREADNRNLIEIQAITQTNQIRDRGGRVDTRAMTDHHPGRDGAELRNKVPPGEGVSRRVRLWAKTADCNGISNDARALSFQVFGTTGAKACWEETFCAAIPANIRSTPKRRIASFMQVLPRVEHRSCALGLRVAANSADFSGRLSGHLLATGRLS